MTDRPSNQRPFQGRVVDWMMETFSMEVCRNTTERNHRFLEEALELVQAMGCTAAEAHMLVDYTFGRPVGDPEQEVGGALVTLAALCSAADISMAELGERELARCWQNIDRIRFKQAGKPRSSPLPGPSPVETTTGHCIDCIELKNALAAAVKVANEARECHDRDQDMRTMKLLIALSGHLPKWRADTDRIHDVLRRAVERLSAPMPPEEPSENLTSRQHAARNALQGCTCGSDGNLHRFNCQLRREGDDGKGAVKASGESRSEFERDRGFVPRDEQGRPK